VLEGEGEIGMGRAKAIVASYVGVVVFASVIFLAAGKVAYWQGLLYLALALVGTTLNHVLAKPGSNQAAERANEAQSGEAWDKRLLGVSFLLSIVMFAVAGLDSGRFGWSGAVPMAVTVAGVILMLLGQTIFAVAQRQNQFFSATVRIQEERGHRVCDTGLYRLIRHPGYLGMLLMLLAFPLVLNSYWALIPAVAGAAVLVLRTALEDRFLTEHLAGYVHYAARTKWRLIPLIF
jgi:protein-S-isoprenylcysteine O-methyltransferase Ste14